MVVGPKAIVHDECSTPSVLEPLRDVRSLLLPRKVLVAAAGKSSIPAGRDGLRRDERRDRGLVVGR
jgi:hypothetical protein